MASDSPVPGGIPLAPGVTIGGLPACDNVSSTSCSGNCVTWGTELNGCQALGMLIAVSYFEHDHDGLYFSQQSSSVSYIYELDADTGLPDQRAVPPGDNIAVRLSLTDDDLYFDVRGPLFKVPRSGGDVTDLQLSLPVTGQFVVVGDRAFVNDPFDPKIYEIDLGTGTQTEHARGAKSMRRDGTDLLFTQDSVLYVAPGADIDSAMQLSEGPAEAILGIENDYVYALAAMGDGGAVYRFPRAGGAGILVRALDPLTTAALGPDAIAFTVADTDRDYVCTADLDGKHPLCHGYLPGHAAGFAVDENYVYATLGFNFVRFNRHLE